MKEKILVAYASTHGSTREIAEDIASTLREDGHVVDLLPMRTVQSLEEYCMIVLGAPLYMFHWHADALHFLARFKQVLPALPVAVFALGPFHDKEEEWIEIRSELAKELAKYPWFTPMTTQIFGGKFDPAHLHFPWNLIPALKQMPPSDIRNWTVIRAWARNVVEQFSMEKAEAK